MEPLRKPYRATASLKKEEHVGVNLQLCGNKGDIAL